MNHQASITDKLKAGIEAARAGRNREAQSYLTEVLKLEPENIPALFWLAFVLPDAQASIRLLERVLVLDPDNKRAQAGIQWAKSRLQNEATPAPATPQPAETSTPKAIESASSSSEHSPETDSARAKELDLANVSGAALREKLLSSEAAQEAKKGPLAHRARRTFDPLTILLVIVGLIGLLGVGLAISAVNPADTLADWWPSGGEADASRSALTFVKTVKPGDTAETTPQQRRLASEADTIIMQIPELMGIEAVELDPLTITEVSAQSGSPELPVEEITNIAADPTSLIGPDFSTFGPQPVDNLLLAHQPAYPGEKWVEVNVTTQQITAWEGNVPVFTFTGSTGLPYTPTVLGEFNIYWKLESTLMAGPNYYLPDVPYTMYFYGGYALHGAYWHNNFGQPMSHGCVNLSIADSQTLFEWADPVIPPGQTQVVATAENPGTLVVVHQ
jgi:hypothetical protein